METIYRPFHRILKLDVHTLVNTQEVLLEPVSAPKPRVDEVLWEPYYILPGTVHPPNIRGEAEGGWGAQGDESFCVTPAVCTTPVHPRG